MAHNGSINYLRNGRSQEQRNQNAPKPEPKKPFKINFNWKPFALLAGVIVVIYLSTRTSAPPEVGEPIMEYNGVPVYYNGDDFLEGHGNNYSEDNYYYGQKWQCVEFVKRYMHVRHRHKMPNPFGNAVHFYKPELRNGQLNVDRGMLQFHNGDGVAPQAEDIMVFADTEHGHVAIVAETGPDYVEIIQQNIYEKPRERLEMVVKDGKFYVSGERKPSGWLRLPDREQASR